MDQIQTLGWGEISISLVNAKRDSNSSVNFLSNQFLVSHYPLTWNGSLQVVLGSLGVELNGCYGCHVTCL